MSVIYERPLQGEIEFDHEMYERTPTGGIEQDHEVYEQAQDIQVTQCLKIRINSHELEVKKDNLKESEF